MRRNNIILLAALAVLWGCSIVPKVSPLADADSWEIPVVPAKIADAETRGHEGDGGTEEVKPEMVIVVPPSDKPTKIEIRPKRQSIFKRVLTNQPAHEVRSDNKDVKPYQPKKRVWWRWVLVCVVGLFLVAALVMAVANRVANFSPLGFIKKLFGKG